MLGVLWIAGMVSWGIWGLGTVALAISVINLAWAHRIHSRLEEASDAIENAAQDLELLAGVLELIESERFSAPQADRDSRSIETRSDCSARCNQEACSNRGLFGIATESSDALARCTDILERAMCVCS